LGSLGNWIKPNSAGYPTIFKVITLTLLDTQKFPKPLFFSKVRSHSLSPLTLVS